MAENCLKVPEYLNVDTDVFKNKIQVKRQPALIRNADLGECVNIWSSDYLINKAGSLPVKVHVGLEGRMNFLKKNFAYKTILFEDLIRRSSREKQEDGDFIFSHNEFYYLRSLSGERRGKEVANIKNEFPMLSEDIKLPQYFEQDQFFSSVLRIGSAGVQMWTHYDVMDNLLIQIKGSKKVVLFSPSDASYMYLDGDKSEILDIDNPDYDMYPKFKLATRYECVLEPGDVLFIPALWFHNTVALTYSINVNVFWKNLQEDFYDKNDFYGNKDFIPANKMLLAITKAMKNLDCLPQEYKDFYAKRAIRVIEKMSSCIKENEK